jgi:hypothetical protein
MVMTPSHEHKQVDALFSALILPYDTAGAPGFQGVVVAGTHAIGVSTPSAAAVAVITAGLVGLEHMPKGAMFSVGTKSMIVAAGILEQLTLRTGKTVSVEGAAPKLHARAAPDITWIGIAFFLFDLPVGNLLDSGRHAPET